MFIGGTWRQAPDGRTIDVLNPATEEVVASVPNATDADLDDALAAAAAGFEVWRRSLPVERAEVLDRPARLVLDRVDEIAAILTEEQGKPLAESATEVRQSAEYFSWFAAEAVRSYGRLLPTAPGRRSWSTRSRSPRRPRRSVA